MGTQKVLVEGSTVSASQLKDLFRQIDDESINGVVLQKFLDHENPFEVVPFSTAEQLKSWAELYREEFNETHDFSGVTIPTREGFTRPIIVAKGMTPNRAYEACKKHFPCWRYADNLDTEVPTNDRTPTEHYAVCIHDRQEADEEFKNLSADDLAAQKMNGITLLERLLLELKYFRETGKHLDKENVTLCSGSRDRDGGVPDADWSDGRFGVSWGYADDRGPGLRSREAVIL